MISKVCTNSNENPNPYGFGFLLCADRFEKLNAARMSAACEGLTEQYNNFSSRGEEKRNQIWSVPPKKTHTIWCVSFFCGKSRFEDLNADVRWTSACRQLDGGNSIIYLSYGKINADKSWRYRYLQSILWYDMLT